MKKIFLSIFVLMATGCVMPPTYNYTNKDIDKKIPLIEASITPICMAWGCKSFKLYIKNLSDKQVEISWADTKYIVENKPYGEFMLEDSLLVIRDPYVSSRITGVATELIQAGGNISKEIFPTAYASYDERYSGPKKYSELSNKVWEHKNLPLTEIGVLLTINLHGNLYSQKMMVAISKQAN